MKLEEVGRAWFAVARAITDPESEKEVCSLVNFTAGYLLGGEQAYGAALLIGLAEAKYGNPPWLVELKHKVGLAGAVDDGSSGQDTSLA